MTISANRDLIEDINRQLTEKFPIKLGVNKSNELVRLVFELCFVQGASVQDVLDRAGIGSIAADGKDGVFHKAKKALIGLRYPLKDKLDDLRIMPLKIGSQTDECSIWDQDLHPNRILIENSVRELDWTNDFVKQFSGAEVSYFENIKDELKGASAKDPLELYNSRRENVFLVRNKTAFIKICPCTKGDKMCGYWILNIGFGCPVDCSYCYLQTYSNSPGMILTANIEDYCDHIMEFDAKAPAGTRIGTGEFTDSLALDKYTGYSSRLIPFFSKTKNLVLELKTKVSDIDNVLNEEPNENVVISWSINTPGIAEKFEMGAASVKDRIDAALRAAKHGYKVGFHFDPLIFYDKWEQEYKAIVEEMFSFDEIRKNTVWISLGTLRYTPGLKQAAEQRFADNSIFYEGEFFLDSDGKMRYQRGVRMEMYSKMIEWIKGFTSTCWIYPCMEVEDVWKELKLEGRV